MTASIAILSRCILRITPNRLREPSLLSPQGFRHGLNFLTISRQVGNLSEIFFLERQQ